MTVESEIAALQTNIANMVSIAEGLTNAVTGKINSFQATADTASANITGQFNSLLNSSVFDEHVSNASGRGFYIDPIDGSDSNDGSSDNSAIKTSARLFELIGQTRYETVGIKIKAGTELVLNHSISANGDIGKIDIRKYDVGDSPIIRQGKESGVQLRANHIFVQEVELHTYSAAENEAMIDSLNDRKFFDSVFKVTLIERAALYVHDNPFFYIYNTGSGYPYHANSLSLNNAILASEASADGVTGASKTIFAYANPSTANYPIDCFGESVGVVYGVGVHTNLQELLGIEDTTFLRTNLSLTTV